MMAFAVWLYLIFSIIFMIIVSLAVFIVIVDKTQIGKAIRDYILSQAIKEKERNDEIEGSN